MGGLGRHVGGEVMHLPRGGDREMQRVEPAVDHHRAIFPRVAIGAPRIQELDRPERVAGQRSDRRGEAGGAFDAHEMAAGVEAGAAQQKRKAQALAREERRRVGRLERGAGEVRHARHDEAGNSGEAARVLEPRRGAHRVGPIDHRRRAAREERSGRGERGSGAVGIADRVEDETMRRQRDIGAAKFGDDGRDAEQPVIEQEAGRDVAAARRDEEQQRLPLARAAIGQIPQEAVAEAERAMAVGRLLLAELGQGLRHALMRRGEIGRERQRAFVMFARLRERAVLEQEIGEVDLRRGIAGMARRSLAVKRARGAAIALRVEEIGKVVERAEMRRRAGQHREIILLGLLGAAERCQQPRAPEARLHALGIGQELRRDRAERRLQRAARGHAHRAPVRGWAPIVTARAIAAPSAGR